MSVLPSDCTHVENLDFMLLQQRWQRIKYFWMLRCLEWRLYYVQEFCIYCQ